MPATMSHQRLETGSSAATGHCQPTGDLKRCGECHRCESVRANRALRQHPFHQLIASASVAAALIVAAGKGVTAEIKKVRASSFSGTGGDPADERIQAENPPREPSVAKSTVLRKDSFGNVFTFAERDGLAL